MLSAPSALAADMQVKGAKRTVRIQDDLGLSYHPATIERPLEVIVHGPGSLSLTLRARNPAGETNHAELQILVDGTGLLDLSLDGEAGGTFEGHPELTPGKRVDRQIKIGPGSHTVSVKVSLGGAVVALAFERAAPEPIALAPLEAAPLAAAPLSAAPLTAEPLAPSTATPPPPTEAAAPAPATATQDKAAEPETRTKSSIPYYVMGGAVLVGAGSLIAWGLGESTYGNYKTTPEVRGGTVTNRGQILSQANNDLAWAEGLGIVAVAALAGAAIIWSF